MVTRQKVRIVLKAFDHKMLDLSAGQTPADSHPPVLRHTKPPRRQRFARTLWDTHPQAAHRHPRAHLEDHRLVNAAEPAGRRWYLYQAL